MSDEVPAILLLEADEETGELYERELGRHYRVFRCQDEVEAFRFLETADVQAIVLEPGVSEGGGWRLLECLRDIPRLSSVRIVLCSTLDERRRGLSLGASAYLVKPILPVTLLDTLSQVLVRQVLDS
jgi:DNA-binding response OmpR family regulator